MNLIHINLKYELIQIYFFLINLNHLYIIVIQFLQVNLNISNNIHYSLDICKIIFKVCNFANIAKIIKSTILYFVISILTFFFLWNILVSNHTTTLNSIEIVKSGKIVILPFSFLLLYYFCYLYVFPFSFKLKTKADFFFLFTFTNVLFNFK